MRQIKFRGVDVKTGAYVFGDLIHDDKGRLILSGGQMHRVEEVAQFVWKDSKGREVYENDKVLDKFGEEYTAHWTRTLQEGEGGVYSKPTERFWEDRAQYTPLYLKGE